MALNLFEEVVAWHPSDIKHLALDVTFEKGGNLEGATAEFVALRNGLLVVLLNLFPSLRVQRVNVDGQAARLSRKTRTTMRTSRWFCRGR